MLNKIQVIIITIVLLAILFIVSNKASAEPAEKTMRASINIMESAINIQMTKLLEFGQIRPIDATDTPFGIVTVDPESNLRTASSRRLLGAVNADLHNRAEFNLTGPNNGTFNIILTFTRAEHDKGTNPDLEIKDLVTYIKTTGQKIFGVSGASVFDSNGNQTIYVGGSLIVSPEAKKGKYQGAVTITINN